MPERQKSGLRASRARRSPRTAGGPRPACPRRRHAAARSRRRPMTADPSRRSGAARRRSLPRARRLHRAGSRSTTPTESHDQRTRDGTRRRSRSRDPAPPRRAARRDPRSSHARTRGVRPPRTRRDSPARSTSARAAVPTPSTAAAHIVHVGLTLGHDRNVKRGSTRPRASSPSITSSAPSRLSSSSSGPAAMLTTNNRSRRSPPNVTSVGLVTGNANRAIQAAGREARELAAADERAPKSAVGVERRAVGKAIQRARVAEHRPRADGAGVGLVGIRVVLGGGVTDDQCHHVVEHADRGSVGVADVFVDDAPAVDTGVPPRRAFLRAHVQLPVMRLPARSAHASLHRPPSRVGVLGEQPRRAAIGIDDVQPVVQHADEQAVLGGHDPGRHRRRPERVQLVVLVVEPVQRLRRAVDEVQAVVVARPRPGSRPSPT